MKALLRHSLILTLLMAVAIPFAGWAGIVATANTQSHHLPVTAEIHPASPEHGSVQLHHDLFALEEIEEQVETDCNDDLNIDLAFVKGILKALAMNPITDQQIHGYNAEHVIPHGSVQRRHLVLCTFLI